MTPLSQYQKFRTFATQKEAKDAGFAVDAYDPALPVKFWQDPNPPPGDADYNGVVQVRYDLVFRGFKNGVADLGSLVVPADIAKRFNIPFTGEAGEATANIPGAERPGVPCPLTPLPAGAQIRPAASMLGASIPQVWTQADSQSEAVSWTNQDRALLTAIATKIGAV